MQLVGGQPYLRIVLARKGRIPVPSVGDWWFFWRLSAHKKLVNSNCRRI
jgi:hypothetical protein